MFTLRGVPGRAALRKNAKKAVKKLKEEEEQQHLLDVKQVNQSKITSEPSSVSDTSSSHENGTNSYRAPEPLLKLISSKMKTPQKCECIMHMAPSVVGWVIGKGGQRIRDLMVESGAKVWIDQDSMGPNEARIVYVSGGKANVDCAVRMVKDLVAKAPIGSGIGSTMTPKEISKTNGHIQTQYETRTPSLPLRENHESHQSSHIMPISIAPARTSLRTEKTDDSNPQLVAESVPSCSHAVIHEKSNRTTKVITCEPMFVALLIGRRGWTVKHIQDASGARVDIDQTVTPRKITISGDEKSVKSASKLVKDVLSYPHAQLHYGEKDDGIISESGDHPLLDLQLIFKDRKQSDADATEDSDSNGFKLEQAMRQQTLDDDSNISLSFPKSDEPFSAPSVSSKELPVSSNDESMLLNMNLGYLDSSHHDSMSVDESLNPLHQGKQTQLDGSNNHVYKDHNHFHIPINGVRDSLHNRNMVISSTQQQGIDTSEPRDNKMEAPQLYFGSINQSFGQKQDFSKAHLTQDSVPLRDDLYVQHSNMYLNPMPHSHQFPIVNDDKQSHIQGTTLLSSNTNSDWVPGNFGLDPIVPTQNNAEIPAQTLIGGVSNETTTMFLPPPGMLTKNSADITNPFQRRNQNHHDSAMVDMLASSSIMENDRFNGISHTPDILGWGRNGSSIPGWGNEEHRRNGLFNNGSTGLWGGVSLTDDKNISHRSGDSRGGYTAPQSR